MTNDRSAAQHWGVTLPEHWTVGQIKNAASVTLGKMLQATDSGGDIEAPYLRAANVQPDGVLRISDAKRMWFAPREIVVLDLRAGDVVVVEGGVGGYGRAAYVGQDLNRWGFQNSINRLRPYRAEGRFLAYYLIAARHRGYVQAICNIVSMPHFTAEKLAAMRVPLPPLREQCAIADYLDRETAQIDVLIGKQERLIETLRERRAAVVEQAFLVSDGLAETRVRNLLLHRPSYGVLVPTYVEEEDAVPFVRVGDLGRLHPDMSLPRIPLSQSAEFARTRLCGGEVLLGVVGNMGKSVIAPEWLAGANVARAVAVLRCRPGVDTSLLNRWFGTRRFLEQATLATGSDTAQPTLGMKDLASFSLLWPSGSDEQHRIAVHLDGQTVKIDALIEKAERFIEVSKERRSALITAAVTGQIDVQGRAPSRPTHDGAFMTQQEAQPV